MTHLVRLGYAFGFMIVAAAAALVGLAYVSRDAAFGFMYGHYWLAFGVLGYFMAPSIQVLLTRLRLRADGLDHATRCAYALAFTIAVSLLVVAWFGYGSGEGQAFLFDYYWAGIFFVAYALTPVVWLTVRSMWAGKSSNSNSTRPPSAAGE